MKFCVMDERDFIDCFDIEVFVKWVIGNIPSDKGDKLEGFIKFKYT